MTVLRQAVCHSAVSALGHQAACQQSQPGLSEAVGVALVPQAAGQAQRVHLQAQAWVPLLGQILAQQQQDVQMGGHCHSVPHLTEAVRHLRPSAPQLQW